MNCTRKSCDAKLSKVFSQPHRRLKQKKHSTMLEQLLLDLFPLKTRCPKAVMEYASPPYPRLEQKKHDDAQEQQTRPLQHKLNYKKHSTILDWPQLKYLATFSASCPQSVMDSSLDFRLNWTKHYTIRESPLQHLSSLVAAYPGQLKQRTEPPYLRLPWTNLAIRLEINPTMRDRARPVHLWSQLVKAAQWAVGHSATGFQEDGFNGIDFGMIVWCAVGR